jgi:hypothetical protein
VRNINANGDINQTIQSILQMRNAGQNPQMIMQMLLQRNPQYQQLLTQMQNMAQGRNPRDFIMQLAKQNGVSEQNINAIRQMFQ